MEVPGFTCRHSGRCCRDVRVSVTLADIDCMAAGLGLSHCEVLDKYLCFDDSRGMPMFLLRQDEDNQCLLRSADGRCAIHDSKPAICSLYICDESLKSVENYPWPLMFDNLEGQMCILEHGIAHEFTSAYLKRNGADWNQEDFDSSVCEIKSRIETAKEESFKAARQSDRTVALMSFDCDSCKLRPSCCKERPLTIDDVRAVSEKLGMDLEEFFDGYVSAADAESDEPLFFFTTSDDGACLFLNSETGNCKTEDFQPVHCRFMPCPIIEKDQGISERYFMGSGSLKEQFRHSAALTLTRQYVAKHGGSYDSEAFEKILSLLESVIANPTEFERFAKAIGPFRYETEA